MIRSLAVLSGLFLLTTSTLAQTGPQPTPTPQATPSSTPVPTVTPGPTDPRQTDTPGPAAPSTPPTAQPSPTPTATPTPAPKNIDETIKGYDKTPGLWTIYRKLEKNKQQFYAELTEAQLNQIYLLQSTFETGNAGRIQAGRPARDLIFRWKKTPDDRLILSSPNPWYRANDPNLKTAVERDFPDAFLAAFPIVARQKERDSVLIDLAPILDGSVTGLGQALEGAPGSPASYVLDSELSFVDRVKSFPANLVAEVQYHFRRRGIGDIGTSAQADQRSLPVRLVYNLYPLPQDTGVPGGFQSRPADPRVGYFLNGQIYAGRTGFESFDDDAALDARVIYINRWRLEKADPAAKLSAPVKPIRFIIDNSIPAAYRQAVREGILSWNRAFERIGFKNAVVVQDPPKDGDFDHADMRYNVVRWVASPPSSLGAVAVALLRENPMSGELLNASISVSSNFARFGFIEKQEIVNPLEDVRKHETESILGVACELGHRWAEQAMGGVDAAQAAGIPIENKRYVNDLLRALVGHEFGHILGLRHNFLASTLHSPQVLSDPATVRRSGITASMMDYIPFNLFGLRTGADLFMRGPGLYDQWAIEYGYTPLPVGKEGSTLKRIAAKSILPGHAYQTDDIADFYDPTVVRYDLSNDPLTYAERSFGVNRYLLATLPRRHPKPGESYTQFTRRLNSFINRHINNAEIPLRFIGGARQRRVVRGGGSKEEPFEPVSAAQSRRALDILARNILASNALYIPESYFRKTMPDPYDFNNGLSAGAYPVRDTIARLRMNVLNSVFASARLTRISNLEYKFRQPGASLRLIDLFPTIRQSVWGSIDARTVVPAAQRDLQKAHLQILIELALQRRAGVPTETRAIAESELRQLRAALTSPRQSSPDAYTRLHFADTIRRIESVLREKVF